MTDATLATTLEDHVEAALAAAYEAAKGKPPEIARLVAIAMRVGTMGRVATLDEAGDAAGVTRERMRQIIRDVLPHFAAAEIPGIAEVAQTLADLSPVPEPIGQRLSGATRSTLTGPGFLSILKLLGTSPAELIGKDLICVDDWLVEESEVPVMRSASLANKQTSAYGMTTVEEIREAIQDGGTPVDADDVRSVLEAQKNIRWAGEWLWMEKEDGLHANRLINSARSILSVNSPQSVESIHEGCRRMWRFRKVEVLPSISAMRSFFDASPHFVHTGNLVEPVVPLDFREVLGPQTIAMIEVLKSQPHQIMDRRTLTDACDEAGIAKGTYGIWMTFAEWMESFGPNVWGLRGSNPNPAVVEAVRLEAKNRAKAEARRKEWAWDAGGHAVQTFDIRSSFIYSGVMSFSPEIHKVIAGQQLTVRHAGEKLGVVKLGGDHPFCWGWAPVLKSFNATTGNVMRISLNVSAKEADVIVGGQELWDI